MRTFGCLLFRCLFTRGPIILFVGIKAQYILHGYILIFGVVLIGLIMRAAFAFDLLVV